MSDADPGLSGVRPFRFECHRCGRCCTVGDGYVWLTDDEPARLAQFLGLDEERFRERFVRVVPHPETGELHEALTENPARPGRCALLEGDNECSAYAARPAHCSAFPYWPSVLESAAGFERARDVCPGIEEQVDTATQARAFAELRELFAEVDAAIERSGSACLARGACCRFEEAGHELFAGALEADYAAHLIPHADQPEADGRCPYHVRGACTAREGRPLGCRTYFCDPQTTESMQANHEHFLRRLRDIESRHGYPRSYARFPALLKARGVGTADSES